MSKFANVGDKISFPRTEEETLIFWTDIDAFQQSIKLSEGRPEYTFYDGPPFATGTPHYGYVREYSSLLLSPPFLYYCLTIHLC